MKELLTSSDEQITQVAITLVIYMVGGNVGVAEHLLHFRRAEGHWRQR